MRQQPRQSGDQESGVPFFSCSSPSRCRTLQGSLPPRMQLWHLRDKFKLSSLVGLSARPQASSRQTGDIGGGWQRPTCLQRRRPSGGTRPRRHQTAEARTQHKRRACHRRRSKEHPLAPPSDKTCVPLALRGQEEQPLPLIYSQCVATQLAHARSLGARNSTTTPTARPWPAGALPPVTLRLLLGADG